MQRKTISTEAEDRDRKISASTVKKDDLKSDCTPAATQHAALCFRRSVAGECEILLVTSRDTGRWVLPKGWPKKTEGGGQTALREAAEEAGVVGDLVGGFLGVYGYDKTMPNSPALPCWVAVHPVEVLRLDDAYPELNQRQRQWFRPDQAAEAVREPELKSLLATFAPKSIDAPRLGRG